MGKTVEEKPTLWKLERSGEVTQSKREKLGVDKIWLFRGLNIIRKSEKPKACLYGASTRTTIKLFYAGEIVMIFYSIQIHTCVFYFKTQVYKYIITRYSEMKVLIKITYLFLYSVVFFFSLYIFIFYIQIQSTNVCFKFGTSIFRYLETVTVFVHTPSTHPSGLIKSIQFG